jgi:hypothetical protein
MVHWWALESLAILWLLESSWIGRSWLATKPTLGAHQPRSPGTSPGSSHLVDEKIRIFQQITAIDWGWLGTYSPRLGGMPRYIIFLLGGSLVEKSPNGHCQLLVAQNSTNQLLSGVILQMSPVFVLVVFTLTVRWMVIHPLFINLTSTVPPMPGE